MWILRAFSKSSFELERLKLARASASANAHLAATTARLSYAKTAEKLKLGVKPEERLQMLHESAMRLFFKASVSATAG